MQDEDINNRSDGVVIKKKQDTCKAFNTIPTWHVLILYYLILAFIFNFIILFIFEEIKENPEVRGIVCHSEEEY